MSQGLGGQQRKVSLRDKYELKRPLGKGSFGEVMLAVHKDSGCEYAAKIIHKKRDWSLEEFRKRVAQEVTTLQMVRHKNIIELHEHIPDGEQQDKHWVIMQLATGGQLLEHIIDRYTPCEAGSSLGTSAKGYTEKEVADIIGDVLRACAHMHARQIVHCDLKPDNILFEHKGEDSALVIADFGLAQLREDEYLTRFCGTLDYMAPELLQKDQKYNEKVDVWAVGCLMYLLLSGSLPFRRDWGSKVSKTQADLNVQKLILSGKVDVTSGNWCKVQEQTKELLKRMLAKNSADRPTAEQCLQDEWFKGGATDRQLEAVVTDLKRFNSSRGQYGYTSHSMAGIITQHASISTLAALGSQETDLANRFKEGGIQSAVSLGCSDNIDEQINSVSIFANLAQQNKYQQDLINEGAVRLVCNMVIRSGAQGHNAARIGELFFFASLMFNHIANNKMLRIALADAHTRYDVQRSAQVIPVLVKLAMEGPKRVLNNAVCALSRLALETQLQGRLIDAGAIPLMMHVADPQQRAQDPFGKTALNALECLLHSCTCAGVKELGTRVQELGTVKLTRVQESGIDELKKRVQIMCGPTKPLDVLLEDVAREEEAVKSCTTEVQAVIEKRRVFEKHCPSRSRQDPAAINREQSMKKKEYDQIQELEKLSQAHLRLAEIRLVNAKAAHKAASFTRPLSEAETQSDQAETQSVPGDCSHRCTLKRRSEEQFQSCQQECSIWRTLKELDKRIANSEALRAAFQEAVLPPISEYAKDGGFVQHCDTSRPRKKGWRR